VSKIVPIEFGSNNEDYSITGWPKKGDCTHCGAPSVFLWGMYAEAEYECRGNPTDPRSAYGPDRCGAVFIVTRTKED
jgi:hypothetical protein